MSPLKKVHVVYYALLKEERGLGEETLQTTAASALEFYRELQKKFRFTLSDQVLKVAVNDEFMEWNTSLKENDTVIFLPPASGG